MTNSAFSLVDICNIPMPYINVIPFPGKLKKYIMAYNPYPAQNINEDSGDSEYPCLCYSTDKMNLTLVNGSCVPVISKIYRKFNADPEIIYVLSIIT